jgi:hypothetical protein
MRYIGDFEISPHSIGEGVYEDSDFGVFLLRGFLSDIDVGKLSGGGGG